ncbi:MAG: thioredoxin family protein [Egibacteraceae bacterium]
MSMSTGPHRTDWLARLERSGLDTAPLGGSAEARHGLAASLAELGVLEAAPGGRARLAERAATRLESAVVQAAACDAEALRAHLVSDLGLEGDDAEHLLVHWTSPARIAAAELLAPRLATPGTPVLPAAELVARLWLLPWLDAVVEPGEEPGGATVSPERLLELMLASGTLQEEAGDDEGVLVLAPAFLAVRGLRQEQARRWRATERRERLGALLDLSDEALSEGYRLAGSGRALGELLTLHQLTALSNLGLWTAWQALASFARPFQAVAGADLEPWLRGEAVLLVSSPSSRPAQAMEELLAEALRSVDVPVGVVNADDERALCERLDVDRPPMVLLLRDGHAVDRIRWTHTPVELRDRIERFLDEANDPQDEATTTVPGTAGR